MRKQRTFSLEFKRQVVEELMNGESGTAQLWRKYNICSSLLYRWKELYSRGRFNNEPTQEGALRDRIEKLKAAGSHLSSEAALKALNTIHEVRMQVGQQYHQGITVGSQRAREVLKALGITATSPPQPSESPESLL